MNTTITITVILLTFIFGMILGSFFTFYIIFKNKIKENESIKNDRKPTKN